MEKYRVLELYSGIGGMHFAFKDSKIDGEVVAAIDINTVANQVYEHNFPSSNLLNRNIESITAEEIDQLNANVLLMSPPCQPFTRNGLRRDAEDPRTDSFDSLLEALRTASDLQYLLLENVKGFENSKTRDSFIEFLDDHGYHYREFLLSPHQFGIPNSRLRYYCLARKKQFYTILQNGEPCYTLPGCENVPVFKISDIIENDIEEDSYLLPYKYLKRAQVLDICYDDSDRSCCFTKAYTHFLEGTGSVYTKSNAEEVQTAFESLDGFEAETDEYCKIVQRLKLRFFTPKEISRLMAFPDTFSFPQNTTKKQCYRLLGNSINVKVVSRLINFLINS